MKNILISVFLMTLTTTFSQILKAQNLVPNYSFEIHDTCPSNISQIYRAVGWYNSRPTGDYFNTCATNQVASVPSNYWGYQYAATGNAYAGVDARGFYNWNSRECIGTYLLSALQIGIKYYVSFKVNLSDREYDPICGVNKLGVLFSTKTFNDSTNILDSAHWAPICNCSQVYTDSIITDTLNWVTIKGSFIADSAYTFISIGNFFVDSLTDTLQVWGSWCYSHYYVDDICVSTDSAFCNNLSDIAENDETNSIIIYPNPIIYDQITIQTNRNEIEKINLIDLNGKKLLVPSIRIDKGYTLNLNSLVQGIYCLNIIFKNSFYKNQIIIKN